MELENFLAEDLCGRKDKMAAVPDGQHMTAAAARPLVYGFGQEGGEGSGSGAAAAADVRDGDNELRVPVTILTGFLGSGKTSLLNRCGREPRAYVQCACLCANVRFLQKIYIVAALCGCCLRALVRRAVSAF